MISENLMVRQCSYEEQTIAHFCTECNVSFMERALLYIHILANHGICIRRTMSVILLAFAEQYILQGSAPRGEFRHSVVNSASNIYH